MSISEQVENLRTIIYSGNTLRSAQDLSNLVTLVYKSGHDPSTVFLLREYLFESGIYLPEIETFSQLATFIYGEVYKQVKLITGVSDGFRFTFTVYDKEDENTSYKANFSMGYFKHESPVQVYKYVNGKIESSKSIQLNVDTLLYVPPKYIYKEFTKRNVSFVEENYQKLIKDVTDYQVNTFGHKLGTPKP